MKIISYESFENIMKDTTFFLPMSWDGNNFIKILNSLFEYYYEV